MHLPLLPGNGYSGRLFARLAEVALEGADVELLHEVLNEMATAGFFLTRDNWNQLATLALREPDATTAAALWAETLPSREFLTHYEFGLFAELAVRLNDTALVGQILKVVGRRQMFLSREIWNRLLQVALLRPDRAMVITLWEGCAQSREFFTAWDQSHFAQLAAQLGDTGLLEMFFEPWIPAQDTLAENEHPTRGTLRAWEPKQETGTAGPFEGAARCLMRWLINRFFDGPTAAFEAALGKVVDAILTLRRNKQGVCGCALSFTTRQSMAVG